MLHNFTIPYCPWSNGSVERLGKESLRVPRLNLPELKIRAPECLDLLPIFTSVLNNSPSPLRGNVCPVTASLGRKPTPPIKTFLCTSTVRPVTLTNAQMELKFIVEDLINICDEIHLLV